MRTAVDIGEKADVAQRGRSCAHLSHQVTWETRIPPPASGRAGGSFNLYDLDARHQLTKRIDAGPFPISKNGTRQWLGERIDRKRRWKAIGASPVDSKDKEARMGVSGPWEIGDIDILIVGNGGRLDDPRGYIQPSYRDSGWVQLSGG